MKTKVFINGRFLQQRTTGVQRYAQETLAALDAALASSPHQSAFEVVVLAPEGTPAPVLRAIGFERVGPFSGHLWEQTTLLAATRGQLLLSFGPTGPLLKKQQVVTIHDAAVHVVPQAFSRPFRAWYKLLLPVLVRRTPAVMTVSEFSKRELVRCFGAKEDEVSVSGEGWQHVERMPPDAEVLARHGLVRGKYVLAVSSLTPHKNFAVVAEAVRLLGDSEVRVVVAGATADGVFGAVDARSFDALKLVGYVSDAELSALYENAAAFVFPSLYEGFGLPPLEAMAHGCPVIAARAAAIPEVCGDAALYFAPSDAAELARLMWRLFSSPEERARYAERGRACLARHSWSAAARAHLSLLNQLALAKAGTSARGWLEDGSVGA